MKKVKDHLGQEFNSITDMLSAYGIDESNYGIRLKLGWSLKDVLTQPVGELCVECVDHLGNRYRTLGEMCKKYKIRLQTFSYRMKRGYTLEEALTKPVRYVKMCKVCYDHLGHRYSSMEDMAKNYGIEGYIYRSRIRLGWSVEKSLTTPVKSSKTKECKDNNGNKFSSITSMCRSNKVTRSKYRERVNRGKSVKEALSKHSEHECVDHLGNTFNCIKEMCKQYGIRDYVYHNRIKLGWSVEKSLTTPVKSKCVKDALETPVKTGQA